VIAIIIMIVVMFVVVVIVVGAAAIFFRGLKFERSFRPLAGVEVCAATCEEGSFGDSLFCPWPPATRIFGEGFVTTSRSNYYSVWP